MDFKDWILDFECVHAWNDRFTQFKRWSCCWKIRCEDEDPRDAETIELLVDDNVVLTSTSIRFFLVKSSGSTLCGRNDPEMPGREQSVIGTSKNSSEVCRLIIPVPESYTQKVSLC